VNTKFGFVVATALGDEVAEVNFNDAQKQVLGPKPAPLTDRKRTFRRCESRPDGIFGEDRCLNFPKA
jgi:hypothetical protein